MSDHLVVDKTARGLVLGNAAKFVLQVVGFTASMKDSLRIFEKLTSR